MPVQQLSEKDQESWYGIEK